MAITPMHGGEHRLTFTADGGDIAAGTLVKATSLTSQQIIAEQAVATGGADGICAVDVEEDAKSTMVMLVPGTVMKVLAEAGVTAGTAVKVSANGKVTNATAPTDNGSAGDDGFLIIGRALTATNTPATGYCMILVK